MVERRVQVTLQGKRTQPEQILQAGLFDTAGFFSQQLLGPGHPADRNRDPLPVDVIHAQVESQGRGPLALACADSKTEGLLSDGRARLELAQPEGRFGHSFEIINPERAGPARLLQQLEGLPPPAAGMGCPGPVDHPLRHRCQYNIF